MWTTTARTQQRGHADTLWYPQLFGAITYESHHFFRVTANGKVMFERAVMKACGGPNAQEQAEHLMAVSGHLLEIMMATYHPAGEFAGRSSNIQWDFRQLWRKSGVDLTGTTSGVCS